MNALAYLTRIKLRPVLLIGYWLFFVFRLVELRINTYCILTSITIWYKYRTTTEEKEMALKNFGVYLDPEVMATLAEVKPSRTGFSELIRKFSVLYITDETFRNAVNSETRQDFAEIADVLKE